MEKYHISRKDILMFLIGLILGIVVSHIFIVAVVLGLMGGYLTYPYLKPFVGSFLGFVKRIGV